MALELECVAATIVAVKPKKKSKKDDSPLSVVIDFEVDIRANKVFPYFDSALRHFLFKEDGVRFTHGFRVFKWDEIHKNMEIDVLGFTLQAQKITKYKFVPYANPHMDDPDFRDCIFLSFSAQIDMPRQNSPVAMLCEMINSEIEISMRPSQLILPEMQEVTKQDQAQVDAILSLFPASPPPPAPPNLIIMESRLDEGNGESVKVDIKPGDFDQISIPPVKKRRPANLAEKRPSRTKTKSPA